MDKISKQKKKTPGRVYGPQPGGPGYVPKGPKMVASGGKMKKKPGASTRPRPGGPVKPKPIKRGR